MKQNIGTITLLVKDYDEAISFYTTSLRFTLVEDTDMGDGKRWVLVTPPGGETTALLLAKASTPQQNNSVGSQTGERVCLFLYTDNFWRDYKDMKSKGVTFLEEPRVEEYGTVVVFQDLYGNKWDFIDTEATASR
jgi:catechol 2,3-dioxygenase-like lactoylglutathione lyase family enzyme